jgi:hypothetical protein
MMGLLEKRNPNANFWSMLRRASSSAIVAAMVYLLVIYFRDQPTEHAAVKIALFSIVCGMIAALDEWQGWSDP